MSEIDRDSSIDDILRSVVREEIANLGRIALTNADVRKDLWCKVLLILPDAIASAFAGDVANTMRDKAKGYLEKGLSAPRGVSGAGGGGNDGGDQAKGSGGGSGAPTIVPGSCGKDSPGPVKPSVSGDLTSGKVTTSGKVEGHFKGLQSGQSGSFTIEGEVGGAELSGTALSKGKFTGTQKNSDTSEKKAVIGEIKSGQITGSVDPSSGTFADSAVVIAYDVVQE